jgi:hypothetical protein
LPFNELAQNGVPEGGLERQLLLEGVHARLAQVANPLQGAAQNPAKIQFIPVSGVFAPRVSLMRNHIFRLLSVNENCYTYTHPDN